ncbi:cbb3-type cytochrome c oxidase subunit II [Castellaniella caeni]|uniref:cbb3-type cytochrome c oxidase subunit II n=1 Tax=Castellaniella caeni TaxID=266123 RepID=UPI00082FED58|nr:cbb3-type cytochrome c oxidase subunit II [Castellaniella caeni]
MESEYKLLSGAMVTLALATATLVVMPYLQLSDVQPSPGLKPYTEQQLRGRQVYIEMGCVYCHSQQPRSQSMAPDFERGWGRAPVAGDYYYDHPHLLGTMRTGPDLFNIGARQPSVDWNLGHLYEPRAYTPGSTMPSFPFLFTLKDKAEEGDKVVNLPPSFAPSGKVVVATPEALDLVDYLIGLNHTYPVNPDAQLPALDPAVAAAEHAKAEPAAEGAKQ